MIDRFSCAILDGNAFSSDVIVSLIERIPSLKIVGNYQNSADATYGLMEHQPDLLFLDMDVNDFSGLDVLAAVNYKPRVIAFSANVLQIFNAESGGAVDFLTKPILDFERFSVSVNRALKHLDHT